MLRNTVSPQMIGVDPLYAGSASFHAMFSVALHVVGSPASVDTPSAVGPRQAGQLASSDTLASRLRTHIRANRRIVETPGAYSNESQGADSQIPFRESEPEPPFIREVT